MRELENAVRTLIARNAQHRRGFRIRDRSAVDVASSLIDEATELRDAIAEENTNRQIEELADVLGVVEHMRQLINVTSDELESEAVRKLNLRFVAEGELGEDLHSYGMMEPDFYFTGDVYLSRRALGHGEPRNVTPRESPETQGTP